MLVSSFWRRLSRYGHRPLSTPDVLTIDTVNLPRPEIFVFFAVGLRYKRRLSTGAELH
jgi:hypothetical protein